MSLTSEVESIIRPIVERMDAFMLEILMRGSEGNRIMEVFVDTRSGVTTDQCAAISREISRELDLRDIVKGRYQLVVSSPGLDRPLRFPYQYPRHLNRTLRVTITEEGKKKSLEGTLAEATDDRIVLELKKGIRREIAIAEITDCIVCTPW
jgi:ribosome maturation factor RimP